jgi:hypothetical protein
MEQTVRVLSLNGDGTAKVARIRQSACSGDCHKCSGCGAVQQTVTFDALNTIGAGPGESVGLLGVKLTGVFAGGFSLLSLLLFLTYNDKKVTEYIEAHTAK